MEKMKKYCKTAALAAGITAFSHMAPLTSKAQDSAMDTAVTAAVITTVVLDDTPNCNPCRRQAIDKEFAKDFLMFLPIGLAVSFGFSFGIPKLRKKYKEWKNSRM